jgi:HNH endonuclease
MGVTDPRVEVDHKSGDGLDNRRENLRICTSSQNQANRRKWQGTSSQFKGVGWVRRVGKWQAQLSVNRKGVHLGYFTDEVEAGMAYDSAAREHFGAFAFTNFPQVVVEFTP